MTPINLTASLIPTADHATSWHNSPQQDFSAHLISAGIDVPHGVQVQLPRASETARDISAFLSPLRPNEPVATQVAVWLNTGFEPAALRGAVALAARGVAIPLHHLPAQMNWGHYLAQFGAEPPEGFEDSGQCLSLAQRFRLLDSAGFDLDARGEATCSPFERAVASNNAEALAALREVVPSRDLSRLDGEGFGLIHHAAANGARDTLNALIEAGVPFDQNGPAGATPLHLAARHGHTQTVNALLEAPGILTNQADHEGDTALHIAADNGHAETVQALIEAGADINQANNDGQTALDIAESSGSTEITQMLRAARMFDPAFLGEMREPEEDIAEMLNAPPTYDISDLFGSPLDPDDPASKRRRLS